MPFKKPSIATYDLASDVVTELQKHFDDVYLGSFGERLVVNTNGVSIVPYHNFPKNFHEYDVHIIDMNSETQVEYNYRKHFKKAVSDIETYSFYEVSFPITHFHPFPLSAHFFASKFSYVKKDKILIVFAGEMEKIRYRTNQGETNTYDSYEFFRGVRIANKEGKELSIEHPNSELGNFLKNYLHGFSYKCEFLLPSKDNLNDDFQILMKNSLGDITAFSFHDENTTYYFLPNCFDRQKEFLLDFLLNYCPSKNNNVFPENNVGKWINQDAYFVPDEKKFLNNLSDLKFKYEKDVFAIKNRIETNRKKYDFLHRLITETDAPLVMNVKEYLNFIGFEKVEAFDHNANSVLEEDLKVELDEAALLVVEVKGINGTSKDHECAQINKIKVRRMKERNNFNVYGLYVVNHQRSREPFNRTNPPFTPHQITDAENDERGLVTTWELFKSYFYVQNGILSKESVQKSLLGSGLILLKPDKIRVLGTVTKTYHGGCISILEIDALISKGMKFFFESKDRYLDGIIETIRFNDKDVEDAKNGEVGIKTNVKLKEGMVIYLSGSL